MAQILYHKNMQYCFLFIKVNMEGKCCKKKVPLDLHHKAIICGDTWYILFRQKPRSALL